MTKTLRSGLRQLETTAELSGSGYRNRRESGLSSAAYRNPAGISLGTARSTLACPTRRCGAG